MVIKNITCYKNNVLKIILEFHKQPHSITYVFYMEGRILILGFLFNEGEVSNVVLRSVLNYFC